MPCHPPLQGASHAGRNVRSTRRPPRWRLRAAPSRSALHGASPLEGIFLPRGGRPGGESGKPRHGQPVQGVDLAGRNIRSTRGAVPGASPETCRHRTDASVVVAALICSWRSGQAPWVRAQVRCEPWRSRPWEEPPGVTTGSGPVGGLSDREKWSGGRALGQEREILRWKGSRTGGSGPVGRLPDRGKWSGGKAPQTGEVVRWEGSRTGADREGTVGSTHLAAWYDGGWVRPGVAARGRRLGEVYGDEAGCTSMHSSCRGWSAWDAAPSA